MGPSPHGFPPGDPWVNHIDPSTSPDPIQQPSHHLMIRARDALIRQENYHTSRERNLVLLWWRLCRRMGLARQALRSTTWWSDSEYSDSHPSPRESSGTITPPSGAMHLEEEGVVQHPGPLPLEEEDPAGAGDAPEAAPPSAVRDKWQEAVEYWAPAPPGAAATGASSSWE